MAPGSERWLEAEARALLASWLDTPKGRVHHLVRGGADFVVEHENTSLIVECKGSSESARLAAAIQQVKSYAAQTRKAVPVVAVPFMGELGKKLCIEAGVSWFDVSGNARIIAPGLRILIDGKPNKFVRRGRPASAFAPKSARIARRLLIEPQRSFQQKDLARETGLDDGFTSRIVHRLEDGDLVTRAANGTVSVTDPDRLLDTWKESYRFDKHSITRGHVSARSGEELQRLVAHALDRRKLRNAATGLGAAWMLTKSASFRLVTFFVASAPSEAVLKEIGFYEEPKGANIWLITPNDLGVFDGASPVEGVNLVHPVQAYLDLGAQPERATDAARELRARCLGWRSGG